MLNVELLENKNDRERTLSEKKRVSKIEKKVSAIGGKPFSFQPGASRAEVQKRDVAAFLAHVIQETGEQDLGLYK